MILAELATAIGLLAQQNPPPEGGGGLLQMALPFMMIAGLYYLMFVLPQRSQNRRLEDLASSLKTNDRVLTTSGIYGVVTNVQRDAKRVTIRIDESTDAKMQVTVDAIGRVLDDGKDKKDKPDAASLKADTSGK